MIKADFLRKIFVDIFALIDQHEEILPKMKIVLLQVEYFFSSRVPLVFLDQESHKFMTVIVRIVCILLAVVSH